MNFKQIKMALYATYLTNIYGLRLKKLTLGADKKRVRLEYSQKLADALNIKVNIIHKEKLPKEGSFLLLVNHRSIIDPVITEIAMRDTNLFGPWIAKKELYNSFFFGLFVRNAGTILIDREASQMSGFFKEIKEAVKKGDSIFLFPEGTRNKSDKPLAEFKDGARIIAMKNRLPILPLYIKTNANEVLKKSLTSKQKEPYVVDLVVGDLVDYKDRSIDLRQNYIEQFGIKE